MRIADVVRHFQTVTNVNVPFASRNVLDVYCLRHEDGMAKMIGTVYPDDVQSTIYEHMKEFHPNEVAEVKQ